LIWLVAALISLVAALIWLVIPLIFLGAASAAKPLPPLRYGFAVAHTFGSFAAFGTARTRTYGALRGQPFASLALRRTNGAPRGFAALYT
jgi:hypothetical protein